MSFHATPYSIAPAIAAALSIVVCLYAWQRRNAPGSLPFIALTALASLWSFGNAFELASADLITALFWVRVEYIGIVAVPVAWLLTMVSISTRRNWFSRSAMLLFVLPLITTGIIWTNGALFWKSFQLETLVPMTTIAVERGPWFWVHTAYSYLLLGLGTLILLRALLVSPQLYRNQTIGLLVGVLAPWIVNILYVFGLVPIAFPDPTALSLVVTSLAFGWSIHRAGLFDIGPIAYERVVRQMSDGVVVLDAQNRIVDINLAATRALRRPANQLVGQPFDTLLAARPDILARYREMLDAKDEVAGEVQVRFDELFIYDIRVTPLHDARGKLSGRLLVWRDITAFRHALASIQAQKEQLENQATALQEAKSAAEAGSKAKSVFLATMSHELRTPLSAMLGYTDLIQYDLADNDHDALHTDLGRIRMAGDHLLRMIDGVLDYAKIEAGKMQLNLRTIAIYELLEEVLAAVRPLIDRNGNQFELHVAPDLDEMRVDPGKLRQVLINLLSNAAKFTQAGTISLRVHSEPCAIGEQPACAIRSTEFILFQVADTGAGMNEGQLRRLFQEFTQVDLALSRREGGTGLGLTVSRKLCQLMAGDITVRSAIGLGSTFTVTLPSDVERALQVAAAPK